MALFKKVQPPLIGVDISSTAVKLLQLSRSGHSYRVESYAMEPLPPGVVVESNITDDGVDAVAEAIERAHKRSGSKAKHAAAAVAGSSVITRVVAMPADLSELELESQVEVEAANYIPFPIEEVNLDFEVIGPTPGNPDTQQVLLAASRAENVERRQNVLDLAGLTAKVIDVEAFAIENAFALVAQDLPVSHNSVIALVDMGSTMTTLYALRGGRNLYSREQVFGGRQLSDEVMRRYNLTEDQARQARRQGTLPESYVMEVLEPFKEAATQQISRLLQFFYAASEFSQVDHIALAGGCAALPGLTHMVEQQLGFTCSIANPLAQMDMGSKVNAKDMSESAPTLLTATGLALRGFD